ncbi:MAG: hypothetical protein WBO55_02990 [Rhizobiaceae bacterium]
MAANIDTGRYHFTDAKKLDESAQKIKNSGIVIITGKVGSGKSIFIRNLSYLIHGRGYQSFHLKPQIEYKSIEDEIDYICTKIHKPIFIFEKLFGFESVVRLIRSKKMPVICELRSGELDLNAQEIQRNFGEEYTVINSDESDPNKLDDYYHSLMAAGIVASNKNRRSKSVRDLILEVINQPHIMQILERELDPNNYKEEEKDFVTLMLINKYSGIFVTPETLQHFTELDPYSFQRRLSAQVRDYIVFGSSSIEFSSPIIAEIILTKLFDIDRVLNFLRKIILIIGPKKEYLLYRSTLPKLINFRELRKFSDPSEKQSQKIIDFYNQIKSVEGVDKEPLFWLQFMIAHMDNGDLDESKALIKKAYFHAFQMNRNYRTEQIDTQNFRLLCQLSLRDGIVVDYDEFLLLSNRLRSMLDETKHATYAIRSIRNICDLANKSQILYNSVELRKYLAILNIFRSIAHPIKNSNDRDYILENLAYDINYAIEMVEGYASATGDL